MKTSVAMCTYNGEKFLREQLDSILAQTLPVDEIIVCDDGSTDKTISILLEYEKKHPGIFKIYQNKENLRSVKNFEKAISLCANEIIFLSDQDDEWLPQKVETISSFLKNNPNIDAVATNGYGIDENGKLLDMYSLWDIPIFFKEKNIPVDFFRIIAFSGNIATGASMAFRKKIFPKIAPFPIMKDFHHDEWIALNTACENQFDFLAEKLFRYRIHPGQQVGNVFVPKTLKNKNMLIQSFDFSIHDKDFISYKRILKRISSSYKKNKELAISENYEDIARKIQLDLEKLFQFYKDEMVQQHPIRGRFTNFTDNILNKRKLH